MLLVNAGALLAFWSIGVGAVKGKIQGAATARSLYLNPGLIATILGIAIVILFPWVQGLEQLDITESGHGLAALSIIVQAIAFVGDVTVPLAMIVTGSMLAGAGAAGAWNRSVIGIAAVRLGVFPLLVMLLLGMVQIAGLHLDAAVGMTLLIISAMPVAVTCTIVSGKIRRGRFAGRPNHFRQHHPEHGNGTRTCMVCPDHGVLRVCANEPGCIFRAFERQYCDSPHQQSPQYPFIKTSYKRDGIIVYRLTVL